MVLPPDSTDAFVRKSRQGFFGRLFGPRVSPVDGPGNDTLGELEQRLKDGRTVSFFRRHRRPIIAATIATLLAAFLWKGGPTFIELAEKSSGACGGRNFSGALGSSSACEGHARYWLYPAMIIPWTHKAALAEALVIRRDEIVRRNKLAGLITLDPEVLRASPAELLKVVRDPSFPSDHRKDDWVFDETLARGDATASLSVADFAKSGLSRRSSIFAALSLADLTRAGELAQKDVDPESYDLNLTRGALLCLTGDEAHGEAALDEAMTAYQAQVHFQFAEAVIAALLCGAKPAVHASDPSHEQIWIADMLVHPDPKTAWRYLDPKRSYEERASEAPQTMFAVWLAKGDPTPRDTITTAISLNKVFAQAPTPWASGSLTSLGIFNSTPIVVDPTVLDAAADKLTKLADDLEKGKVKPFTEADLRDEYDESIRHALLQPLPLLRDAAAGLRMLEASACASSFNLSCEAHAVEKLPDDLRKSAALYLASDFARNGDRATARRYLVDALAAKEATTRFYALLSDAMLDLGEGKKTEAHAAALQAAKLVFAARKEAGQLGDMAGPEMERAAGWVLTATALASGATDIPLPVATPKYFEDAPLPKDWLSLARANDETRRQARLRTLIFDLGASAQQVLPAVIYVLREVARDGKDPDLWVTQALGSWDGSKLGPTALRARAEALRWAGNGDGAKAFDERAAKLEGLFSDPRRAALARLAGIR